MAIDYKSLPVYEQKQKILDSLEKNQVVVVQSPTGSGKTTQLPVILHEAGYSQNGIIAVTQPRRIAAISVSEFIAKQLGTTYPGLVGYKMRFEDKTDITTKIKIMTDGILLQEMKLDPYMSKYSVIMVDEAHERSLNIDFVLGLLKRVLEVRQDLKIIVSSATMNAEAFSQYFGGCPIVTIDTVTFPVTVVYDPPLVTASTLTETATDALLTKIEATISRVLDNGDKGDILIFLPGEKAIRDCIFRLGHSYYAKKLHLVPLYGRLPKEEQEKVFDPAPSGRKKVVISTNIAETSVTINGITTVIDSGLSKINFYSPKNFTSSLIETSISKASSNQRKGRAGRTQAGTCYRLYSRKDFETREEYTTEEIFRTDLSEVILRMAELGIRDFESFDFISQPGREGMRSAEETLRMLKALNEDRTLSSIGKMMVLFPLLPRVSRIIVEAIMHYPDVIEESLIAAAFLSTHSPFILPQGEEMDARKAHHSFRDLQGDFVSYVHLYNIYTKVPDREKFCRENFLDEKVMAEIENIVLQLSDIVSDQGIPIGKNGNLNNYLCCIASGMIQFVCIREGRESYRSLTADHISIHPGSSMFRTDPLYIVAGEIVRTSRMFAMSVSPLTRNLLSQIDPELEHKLDNIRNKKTKGLSEKEEIRFEKLERERLKKSAEEKKKKTGEETINIGDVDFKVTKIKGKKTAHLHWDTFKKALQNEDCTNLEKRMNGYRGKIMYQGGWELLAGEKLNNIITLAKKINLDPVQTDKFDRKLNINVYDSNATDRLYEAMQNLLRVTVAKSKSKELGFVTAFTDFNGNYWFKISRGYTTAVSESLSTLEHLIDDQSISFSDEQKENISRLYGIINSIL